MHSILHISVIFNLAHAFMNKFDITAYFISRSHDRANGKKFLSSIRQSPKVSASNEIILMQLLANSSMRTKQGLDEAKHANESPCTGCAHRVDDMADAVAAAPCDCGEGRPTRSGSEELVKQWV